MNEKKTILVHACCASCSTYVIEHLKEKFNVIAYYYNPNIHPEKEYHLRLEEMKSLCKILGVELVIGRYDPESWEKAISPYRHLPEKSFRCRECYRMRLEETAVKAEELGIRIFTTTLPVSPHKIFRWILETGEAAAKARSLFFHAEDFKKKDGFKISVQKSRDLGLTRQTYCGCLLSLKESRLRDKKKGDKS